MDSRDEHFSSRVNTGYICTIAKLNKQLHNRTTMPRGLQKLLSMDKDDAIGKFGGKSHTYCIPISLWKKKHSLFFVVFFNRTLTNDLISVTNYQATIALTAGTSHFLQFCYKLHHVLHQTEINKGMRALILSNVHGD